MTDNRVGDGGAAYRHVAAALRAGASSRERPQELEQITRCLDIFRRSQADPCGDRRRGAGAENYLAPEVPDAADYPIDFAITGGPSPLFIFGVPTRDRARLATIVLQHIDPYISAFDSIVVFQDASEIPSSDLRRLMNAANDMVDSIEAKSALEKKIRHRLRAA